MRFRLGALIVTMVGVTATAHAQQAPPQEMTFFASIVDPSGAAVRNLKATDIQVIEDDKPGTIVNMEPVDRPIKLSVIVDNGPGIGAEQSNVRSAVEGFLHALPEGMDVSLYSMAPRPRLVGTSADKSKLIEFAVVAMTMDPGASRFGDTFVELAKPFEKDKGSYFPVLVVIGTTSPEASDVKSNGLNKVLTTYREHAATVHVVLVAPPGLGSGSGKDSAGSAGLTRAVVDRSRTYQAEVGTVFGKGTGGTFQTLPNSNLLAEALTGIGGHLAKVQALQTHEYRIVFKRPGPNGTGRIGVSANPTWKIQLTMDGRVQ